ADRGWISGSIFLNQEVGQEYNQRYDGRVTIEPFRDFRIDIEARRDFTENHTQFFKDTLGRGDFVHVIPKNFGSLTVTYSALNTLFDDSRDEIISLFNQFEANRVVISQRIGEGVHSDSLLADQGFTDGYGRTQQDVLIPAFLAAYTGEDANNVGLNVFDTRPNLNWRLTYNGLSRVPLFQELFQNFSLNHGYQSTLTINRFGTGLDFLRTRSQGAINELNGNFYPRLEVPELVIQEGFSPLVGLDSTLTNGMSLQFNYNKTRTLAMSFISNQLSESQSKSIEVGFG
ncbi:MAG: cell surface protein SprA, partial [Saprospiraceae bacterium]|nr:cell surface protein SprA [Saprospiraceae bacterium]